MYGGDTPLEAILSLAIDDGVAGRGHRVNIFKGDFYYTGVDTAAHKSYRQETVTTFSGKFEAPSPPYDAPKIDVPKTAADYKDYAKFDTPSTCGQDGDKTDETAKDTAETTDKSGEETSKDSTKEDATTSSASFVGLSMMSIIFLVFLTVS